MEPYSLPTSLTCDLGIEHTSCSNLSADERKALIKQVKAGDMDELEFDAIVFRAIYPNANYLRFYDKDLSTFAQSFKNQPFLRNHDVRDIGSRDGTIADCTVDGQDFIQRIKLTTERGMLDFLQGRIDRFSIGWYFDSINCSICDASWMECSHYPGQRYKGPGKNDPQQLCELIFVNPRGKETSAVNAPAVRGTKVLSEQEQPLELAQLIEAKQAYLKGVETNLQENSQPAPEEHAETHQELQATDNDIPPLSPITLDSQPQEETAMITEGQETPVVENATAPMQPTETPIPTAAPQATNIVSVPYTAPINSGSSAGYIVTVGQTSAGPGTATPTQSIQPATPTHVAPAPTQTAQPDPQAALWMTALREATINAQLQASGLPVQAQEVVRMALGDNATDPVQVQRLIEAQRKAYAIQLDQSLVHNINPAAQATGRVNGMINTADKFKDALFSLLNNERPSGGWKPLSGIKEAYVLASGDWAMTGRFTPDEAQLANITSSALPDMMAEWMNQRVVLIWRSYDQWYRQFCDIQNFTSLRDPHWIKIGGIGELSTVGEGAAYTEKEWIAESETTGWTKKGNWIGLTIEAIDRDTTGYIQQLPKALVQGAWLTISKDFTRRLKAANGAGYGYTMQSDSKALFHADHGNLGTSALSWSAWEATRIAMARQTDLGTGEVLGGLTLPAQIMVPRHLENTAITLLATERVLGNGNNDINPLVVNGGSQEARMAAARKMLVVNDFLGTDNHWFAFADQQRFPLFGLGFRWGETPEIFSVADPNSGMMFTNDVMPIKIRWYYSLGAIDYRGMYFQRAA